MTEWSYTKMMETEVANARHEASVLATRLREDGWRLVDLSQRQLNVAGVLDAWVCDTPREQELIVRIRGALKMGDD